MEHTSYVAEVVAATFTLLLVALAVLVVAKRSRLPFTLLLVPVGMLIGWLQTHYPQYLFVLESVTISPDLILYIFLPALLFESSFNLDARRLRHNIVPVLALAVPGLLLSTAVIGLIVWLATPIPWAAALLLGAILSATDPIAVVALFREVGAPERLTTLVEGESLFNDATSIVVAKILIGIAVAGTISGETLSGGLIDFFVLFIGGVVLGIGLGYLCSVLIGMVESEPFVEIGLTAVLAYLSFLIAEELFHVSGVMATVGAGLTLGSWGRIRISASVRPSLENFWKLMGFIACALLFMLVGMKVELVALWDALGLLIWVVVGMVLARAVILFGMMPLVGRLPGLLPIQLPFQVIMFWGGLRGAIALAIVLSLPAFEYSEMFVALVMGAVLFTLLVQGLTIEPLMRYLGVDVPPLADRINLFEYDILAHRRVAQRLPELQSGGIFSSRIADELALECSLAIEEANKAIVELRASELSQANEVNLLYQRALTEERAVYTDMYNKGHLTEGAYRELVLVLNMQIDALRYHGAFEHVYSHRFHRRLEQLFYTLAARWHWLHPYAEQMKMMRIVRNYEEVWGHYQSSGHVLMVIDELMQMETIPESVVAEVREKYQGWHKLAANQLQDVSEQFPEFVTSMQERWGRRLILLTELETTEEQAERGMLPKGVAEIMAAELAKQLSALRGQPPERLQEDPAKLLQKVPLFRGVSIEQLREIAQRAEPITLVEDDYLIRQGEESDALYLITRGIVRFIRESEGELRTHGTLIAGEFFGERALAGHGGRDAGVVAKTPCRLYRLRRRDLEEVVARYPALQARLADNDARQRQRYQSVAGYKQVSPGV